MTLRFIPPNSLARLGLLALVSAPACADDSTQTTDTDGTGDSSGTGMAMTVGMTTAPSMTTAMPTDDTGTTAGTDDTADDTVGADSSSTGGEDSSSTGGEDSSSTGGEDSSSSGDSSSGDSSSSGGEPTCGNDMIEGAEECDGTDLGAATCATAGFPDGGVLACDAASCQLDTSGCFECGNGDVEGTEECDDGNNDDGDGCSATCLTEAFAGDTCGDGILVDPTMLPYSDMGSTLDYNNDYGYSEGVCPGEEDGWNAGAEDVVYEFTPDTTGVYTIEFGATWDSTVYMVTDCSNVDGSCVAASDSELSGDPPETIVTALNAGTTYFIIGGHWSNDTLGGGGDYTLTISDACVPACTGLECGDDGCGGSCGTCGAGELCDTGACVPVGAGDTCDDPIIVDPTALPYADSSDTLAYSNDYGYSSGVCPGETGGWNAGAEDVVYSFTPDTTGSYYIAFDTTWDSTLYVVTDCTTIDTTCVAGADNGQPEDFVVDLTAGTTYFIIGGHYSNDTPGGGGPYTLTIQPVSPGGEGDTCANPFVIDPLALPYADSGNTNLFFNDYGYSSGACPGEDDGWNAGAEDVVYSFTPNASGNYTIVFDTTWDSTVYMVTDCADVDGTCVAGADNGNPETITADLTAGTTYFIIGGHYSNFTPGSGGVYDLTVTMN